MGLLRLGAKLALAVSLVLPTVSAMAKDSSQKPITIGFAISLSGRQAVTEGDGFKFAQMWIDSMNAKGGLPGRPIKFVTGDNKTDPAQSARAGVEVLASKPDLVVVSCDYDIGAPAAVQAQRADKISVFMCAVDPKAGVVGVGPDSFSAGAASQLDGAIIADWGFKRKGLKKAFVLEDVAAEAQKSSCAGFKWYYQNIGGEIVGWDQFRFDDASIASQISDINNAIAQRGADTVMICSHLGAGDAVCQIRAAGINLPLLGPSMFDGGAWTSAVPGLANFYIPTLVIIAGDPRPEVQALTKKFVAKYGRKPTSMFAYPIYAWLDLWAKAVTEAGTTDTRAVVDIINKFANVPTVLGPRTFTPELHIQASTPMMISEFTGDSQVYVEKWAIATSIPSSVLYRMGQWAN